MFLDYTLNASKLLPVEASATLHPNGIQPEFRFVHTSLNMDVLRLIAVTRVEE